MESFAFTPDERHDASLAATDDDIAFLAGVLSFGVQAVFCSITPWCEDASELHKLSDVGLVQRLEQKVSARLSRP
jgi:hypothetical protein